MTILYPSKEYLEGLAEITPTDMHPNTHPWVALREGYLSEQQCREISNKLTPLEPFNLYREVATRDCPRPFDPVLHPIEDCVREVNKECWNYDIDQNPRAWLQTYETGDSYAIHMDGVPGQCRKLTGIALLSDPDDYDGGELSFFGVPDWRVVAPTQGTIVVIPWWLLHQVSTIEQGYRQTINMGFYGPLFV